jgi:hypothetical protein
MLHYSHNSEYLNKLYELLVNILLQEEANDNSILEGIDDRPNDRTTTKGN